jgi:RNA polymerase sigma-70 factor (ECF subfamily)
MDYLVTVHMEGGPLSDPKQVFTGWYDQYYRRVLRYALQHADRACAEDIASETFLIAWRRLADVPEQPLPWLLGVTRNLLRQQFGQARRELRLAAHISALTSDADLVAWGAGEHAVERVGALAALGALPGDDLEALTLVTWHGLSAAEAAAVAGCSPHAFTVRLHRARKRLGEALQRAEQVPAHTPAREVVRIPQPSTPTLRGVKA